ncbi:MAG: hypothetical protein OEW93_01895 [Candidatus Bathyarchaeota archaeon]|nr:hypothetical protein [Candidatus Bathyarchaeota archaeon]
MAKEISYAEFIADYEAGLIHDLDQIGSRIYGRSVKGQADNPAGYILVYAEIPQGAVERPWWKFWQRR